jgi:soluble lytic murein transglycosylase-like protein
MDGAMTSPPTAARPRRSRRVVAALLLLAAAAAHGEIYVGSEAATGAVVLSNFPSDGASILVEDTEQPAPEAPPAASSAPNASRTPARASAPRPPAELLTVVERVASRHKLSPVLLNAVIRAASAFDPRAVSPKGAVGLMQLLPSTGRRFGAQDLFSAEQNVDAGAGYLRWLMSLFDNHLDLVLAAYNAGEKAVIDAGCRIPDYPETQAYVRRILDDLKRRGEPAGRGAAAYAGGCA